MYLLTFADRGRLLFGSRHVIEDSENYSRFQLCRPGPLTLIYSSGKIKEICHHSCDEFAMRKSDGFETIDLLVHGI
jgi:hypothetical protein